MKTVVITGGLGDIGRAIVARAQEHSRVIVIDCLSEGDARVIDYVTRGVSYIRADIAVADQVKDAFQKVFLFLDEKKSYLHALINNAGITRDNLALRMSEEQWDAVLDVNLKGAFLCSQQALKRMVKQEKSYIINMSSVVGIHGNPGQANYAASKAGLIALTKTLSQEYGRRGIRVNAIAPGFISTSMTDSLSQDLREKVLERIALHSFGSSDDVAALLSFLISGQADYITGQVIVLDGGMY